MRRLSFEEALPRARKRFIKSVCERDERGESLDLIVIALIIVGAIVLFYATKFLSATMKIVAKIALIIIVLLVILTIIIYQDLTKLKDGLYEGNNTFILYDNGKAYAAITLRPLKNLSFSLDSFGYFTEDELEDIGEAIKYDDYSDLINTNKMIFLMKPEVLDKPYNLSLIVKLNEQDILAMVMSDNPYLIMSERLREEYNTTEDKLITALIESYGEPEKMRGYLFAALLMNYFQSKDSKVVNDMRNGRIMLVPEMRSVKILKLMPGFI